MKKQLITASLITVVTVLALPAVALAHVIVTPGKVGIGQEIVFNISVPNERASAVTSLRLVIPQGVSEVVPTALSGWQIATTGTDVMAITWTGSIPVGQREDFSFGAQAPANATQLDWKAYQTYADGTVVHWDQKPTGSDDASGNAGPYSVTSVVDDLTNTTAPSTSSDGRASLTLSLSVAALVLSLGGLFMRRKPRS